MEQAIKPVKNPRTNNPSRAVTASRHGVQNPQQRPARRSSTGSNLTGAFAAITGSFPRIGRNLANRVGPLDALFAGSARVDQRKAALPPSFLRDIIVWALSLLGTAQLVFRLKDIAPVLNPFSTYVSDSQLWHAMSLMYGGTLGAILTLATIRILTGVRTLLSWSIAIIMVFAVLPSFGLGSRAVATTGIPIPQIKDIISNPIFDSSGIYTLSIIVLAVAFIVSLVLFILRYSTKKYL